MGGPGWRREAGVDLPHRPGGDLRWQPGEANLRLAVVVVVIRVGIAWPEGAERVRASRATPLDVVNAGMGW
ncbi:MAG: hypothetical protein K6T75_01190 [Acetobacteraceae bacterium]|nr:hypothetical protein [Acetobacteraceae bacterium]